ncbi:uncharacterized protein LOC130741551 [Lotus japonicus]|uniref:uncharacterized protein LOC130741551 n=1 Tax=Lotus japonicus TaxID=34305 RepID=UPI0025856775|nr:uncharacterized protein LOC130741551 [Lotus japonicus]
MRGTVDPEALLFDPEIDRTFHYRLVQQRRALASAMAAETNAELEARLRAEFARTQEEQVQEAVRRIQQERELEEANRPLRDLNEPVMSYDYPGSIAPQNAEAQNFELRPALINLISQHQYGGSATEDAHAHLERFIRNCSTTRLPNPELVRLQLFPFSLRDTAEEWLNSQPQGSITTWEDLAKKFIKKFFPRTLLRKLKNDILVFKQEDTENLHEALEMFKKLLRKCPQHNLTLGAQVERFYDGLTDSARSNLEAAASAEFDALSAQAGWDLINKMAESAVNSTNDRQNIRGVLEIEAYDRMVASNKQLSQQMTDMQRQFQAAKISNVNSIHCGTCGGPHASEECGTDFDEEVKVLGNSQNNPYSNTYNPGWRNHPNFSWREHNNSNQGGNNQRQYSNQRFQSQNSRPQQTQDHDSGSGKKSLEELMENFINRADTSFKNHEAAIKNLETQVGQMAKQMSERPPGMFPLDTVINSKENCSAITLRSGATLSEPKQKIVENNNVNDEFVGDIEPLGENKKEHKEKEEEKRKVELENKFTKAPFPPFPTNIAKRRLEKQFSKFISMFKKLRVELPFSEVLEKMPQYAKFMKEILSKKRRLSEENEIVELTEECSAILQRKLPPKRKDPGSFTLPVNFGASKQVRALCDLGSSVNLMPLSMFERLNVGELKPTMMMLQLADRSIVAPWGVREDVLVRAGEFEFPVDFVIIDMDEDSKIPLILGRPFLATSQAKINVGKGTISLRVADEKITFTIFDLKPKPVEKNDVFLVEMMDEWSDEKLKQFFLKEKADASNKKKKRERAERPN